MNINEVYAGNSDYLKAADIKGKGDVTLQISDVASKEFDEGMKLILAFKGKDKQLVLNKTNANIIAEMLGTDTDDWIGSNIDVYAARVEFQGKIVDAIRVRLGESTAGAKGGADSDIPFAQIDHRLI